MAQSRRRLGTTQELAATNLRTFRTFLLMSQIEARAIGARIAQARKEAGLTQEQLVELATFSERSLQDYEAGTTIPYRQMREIGALLNRPVEWFLHGDAEKPDQERLGALLERLDRLVSLLEAEREASRGA